MPELAIDLAFQTQQGCAEFFLPLCLNCLAVVETKRVSLGPPSTDEVRSTDCTSCGPAAIVEWIRVRG